MLKKLLLLILPGLLLTGCIKESWEETTSGIIVNLKGKTGKDTRKIKLDVINDRIIHVVASPVNGFSDDKSLIIAENRNLTLPVFRVKGNNDSVTVSTSEINARVSLSSGQIVFYDKNYNTILKEPEYGGKSFKPFSVEGTDGYSLHQVFESPEDEAFYGLGQHQSDEFNYKGLNEILYQYNTKVSIPFVVSNKNYGLLWDNYSLTKFGDPRDYSQMDLFKLYDDNGGEGGLTATYYINSDPERIFVQRKESLVDYENLETIKNFPEKFPFYNSTITWTGKIEPAETGLYYFKLYYAGYIKVFIEDEPVVAERWRTAWNPNTYKFRKNMEAGRQYPIRIEWKPDGGVSYIGLKALSPRPASDQGFLSLLSEMGDQIDYYFIRGNNIDEVISGYRSLTGKAPIMPKWALGFWQSRERYKSQTELLDVVKEYRRRNIPLDNIVLDWSYWPVDSWGSHEFDPKFFPDPAGMVDEVHRLNAKIMISVWPKFYYTTEHFREFDKRGWMYRQAVNDSIRDWIGKGYIGSFYDAYSPGARELFWNQMKEHLYTKGFDAWWMDASEPDILSNASIQYRKKLTTPTALGPSAKYFNTYALVNAMAIYYGQRSADPETRVFLLTRSGFPGLQRYSTATWSGDIGTRWEDMKAQIPAGLNYAMSGIPYWTFDIGGFCVEGRYTRAREGSEDLEEWRELNTRWYQFGSFCPLFRSHGQYPLREVFNISPEGHPAYKSMVYYDRLRYYLMPYTYSLAGLTYFNDYTIMRAMVMDFGSDKEVESIGDQYMFGPSILVAPVYSYKARSREVYLPETCGWYDLYTGKYFSGGQRLNADAPYERMPLFVREGSIIPVGPEIQFTDEKPADPMTLYVYTGKDCAFTLYEDEGINYNYEQGECSAIKFSFDNKTGKLKIGDRQGEYEGMLKSRTFNIIWISKDKPFAFNPEAHPHAVVSYNGKELIIEK
ncbi:MAG: alpha-xylosidase [Bacteroidetes bacterium RBG_13_43_22]|nr:MAG: alpha-xylosidase [Bacteroidetes bacterium RBG_13_43_22]